MSYDRAGYTTSGRNSTGKSSAIKKPTKAKKAPAAKKAAPKAAPAKSPSGAKSKFPSTMQVPGSARPGVTFTAPVKKAIPATGRDRFGAKAKVSGLRPGVNRQEGEGKIMSAMYRDRLGPGQR